MKIAYLQTAPKFLAVRENVGDALARLAEVRADLAVLPELFNTGYNFRSRRDVASVAERVDGGPTVAALRDFARRSGTAVAAGIAERHGNSFYNSAVLATPQKVHLYRKVHLFYREKLFFKPGNLGFN